MSGHSKWSTIKRKKGALDAKRGKLFTKIIREIQVAARTGGGDPETNPRLRDAISEAKSANMTKDTIERAVKRGTGELEGESYEEAAYEGFGPAGVAVLLDVLTDNKTRTVAELRSIFKKHGGALGEPGSVGWVFDRKGIILLDPAVQGGVLREQLEGRLMEAAVEAGAEDVNTEGPTFEVTTAPSDLDTVKTALEQKGFKVASSQRTALPKNVVGLSIEDAQKMLDLVQALDDHDDVQNVYANFEVDSAVIEKVS